MYKARQWELDLITVISKTWHSCLNLQQHGYDKKIENLKVVNTANILPKVELIGNRRK